MKPQKINIKDISTENKPFLYGLLNTMEDLSEKANKQTKEYEKMFLKIQRISELFENLSDEKKDAVINFFESFTLNEIESFVKHLPSSKNKKKRNCLKKLQLYLYSSSPYFLAPSSALSLFQATFAMPL